MLVKTKDPPTPQNDDQARIDKLIANYVTIRNHIKEVEDKVAKHLAPFVAKREEIAAELLKSMDALGAKSVRTDEGTISALVRETASLEDPDAFMEYVRENDLFELMDRRANTVACREHAKYNGGRLPPGVKLNVQRYIGVRKA